VQEVRDVMLLT